MNTWTCAGVKLRVSQYKVGSGVAWNDRKQLPLQLQLHAKYEFVILLHIYIYIDVGKSKKKDKNKNNFTLICHHHCHR